MIKITMSMEEIVRSITKVGGGSIIVLRPTLMDAMEKKVTKDFLRCTGNIGVIPEQR